LWATPHAIQRETNPDNYQWDEKGFFRLPAGRKKSTTIQDQVRMWRTPDASITSGGAANAEDRKAQGHAIGLHDQVNTPSMWPTCHGFSKDGKSNGPSGNELGRAVNRSLWPTPKSQDWKDGTSPGAYNRPAESDLGKVVGPTKASGSLNPAWVEWLMGYPDGWTALEDSAMPSSRKSRSKSCAPSPQSKEAE
jgi:hypothetical protein